MKCLIMTNNVLTIKHITDFNDGENLNIYNMLISFCI